MTDDRRTWVVNLRKDRYDVYVGRAGRGEDGYFGNPFPLGEQSRGATIERYRGYFLNRLRTDEQFARRVRALKGKTLGCFCKPHPPGPVDNSGRQAEHVFDETLPLDEYLRVAGAEQSAAASLDEVVADHGPIAFDHRVALEREPGEIEPRG